MSIFRVTVFSLILLCFVTADKACVRQKLIDLIPLELPDIPTPFVTISNAKIVELELGDLVIENERSNSYTATGKIHHLLIKVSAFSAEASLRIRDADVEIKYNQNQDGSRILSVAKVKINDFDIQLPLLARAYENDIINAVKGKWRWIYRSIISSHPIGQKILSFFESGCGPSTACASNKVCSGQTVMRHVPYWSPNHNYYFIDQNDGNLVVYDRSNRPIWNAGTVGHTGPNRYSIMQKDGNFVLYSANRPRWDTGTVHNEGAELVMQDDGNLVIYKNMVALWSSRSGKLDMPARHLDHGL